MRPFAAKIRQPTQGRERAPRIARMLRPPEGDPTPSRQGKVLAMLTITRILLGTAILACSVLPAPAARADLLDGLGRWSGSGNVHGPDGRPLGTFEVELTRAVAGPERVETRGTVTTAAGQVIPFQSFVTRTAQGLVTESARGKGHALCVEPNVCHSYELDAAGNGSTSTILIDGDRQLRVLVTELEKGKPVRLIWQTLSQP